MTAPGGRCIYRPTRSWRIGCSRHAAQEARADGRACFICRRAASTGGRWAPRLVASTYLGHGFRHRDSKIRPRTITRRHRPRFAIYPFRPRQRPSSPCWAPFQEFQRLFTPRYRARNIDDSRRELDISAAPALAWRKTIICRREKAPYFKRPIFADRQSLPADCGAANAHHRTFSGFNHDNNAGFLMADFYDVDGNITCRRRTNLRALHRYSAVTRLLTTGRLR